MISQKSIGYIHAKVAMLYTLILLKLSKVFYVFCFANRNSQIINVELKEVDYFYENYFFIFEVADSRK